MAEPVPISDLPPELRHVPASELPDPLKPRIGDPNGPIPDEPRSPAGIESKLKAIGKPILQAGERMATQVTGAEVGGAIGSLADPFIGPAGTIGGAAIGGGLGNVAGSRLPPELGGDPSESTLRAFGWGAVPEGLGRGASAMLESRAAKRGAEASYQAMMDALDKGPVPEEQAGRTAEALGRRSLEASKPLTGEALSDATNSLRQDILDPINQTRRKLGEPIGKAYDALKGNDNTLSPDQIKELQEAAANVKESMLSPYPQAKSVLARIKHFSPPDPPDYVLRGEDRPTTPEDFAQLDKYEEARKAYKPPTLDQLRELRQANNAILRSAKGGDVHAALGLQQAIDGQLMDYLPEGINRDRELYRSFMNRFPWRDINKINEMGTPRELGNYVFGGTPERAAEIIQGASQSGKIALREALTDRVLDKVNPDAPLADQVKTVRNQLTPFIKSGVAASLYGAQNAEEMRNIFYLPEHMAQTKEIIARPEFHKAVVDEVSALMKTGNQKKMDAVEAGWNRVIQALPQQTQDALLHAAPGTRQPALPLTALPSAEQSLAQGLRPGESNLSSRIGHRAEFTAPYAAGRALIGSPLYAAGQLAAMAGIATTSAGYRAIMENGGAGWLAKMMATPGGRAKTRIMIEGLAALGTQAERMATKDSAQTPSP